jgi:hypothetical protein
MGDRFRLELARKRIFVNGFGKKRLTQRESLTGAARQERSPKYLGGCAKAKASLRG